MEFLLLDLKINPSDKKREDFLIFIDIYYRVWYNFYDKVQIIFINS